ncbi:3-phosphoinositide-dependent protein kinase B-like [Ruditapes philippinarum]|uniref:3-phosphoinositide-dependent protein kinase B-like n=1 Tax=Ruditapes philippinarum TaxID=129788 RepID=UPI00295BCEEE|nr:3-phosphoinositide-dependent protein kinase B-like [Ruditapes philippinarum]
MASLANENTHDYLCSNLKDHNISNNGQHLYDHCHREHMQHDKLFMEQEFTSYGIHEKQAHQHVNISNKYYGKSVKEDNIKIKESAKLPEDDANETADSPVKTGDDDADIEIIIFVQKGEDTLEIEVVSKSYVPTENQIIIAATCNFQGDTKVNHRYITNESESSQITQDVNVANADTDIFTTPKKSTNVSTAKHVHFKEQNVQSKHINLRSHKMEKEIEKKELQSLKRINKCNDNCGQNGSDTSIDNKTATKSFNDRTKREILSKSKFKSTTRSTSHVSSSDTDLRKQSVGRLSRKDNMMKQLPGDKKTISILRRDNEIVKADVIEYGESKEYQKRNIRYQIRDNANNQMKNNDTDANKQKQIVQTSVSHTNTSSTGNDARISRRSKSTIDATDAKLVEDRREKEKQRKKLVRKKQRRNKQKTPKTDIEIFQKQIETGQLRSMFSRYKTEGLKCLQLQKLLHKGTFSTKYTAIFKNKQVVLTVFDSEIADLISALDMAHMSNSYFVLGFTDCMTGPYGKLWFMSMFHSFGDLQKILSRDQSRHVIGELHAQFISAGVLLGVDYLHQRNIVHGNIKPSKVLINALGYPVLTGFVKMSDQSDIEGSEAYTPAYAAPEHHRGNRGTAADIFSVGCVAYEIITGWTPFDGETREQTVQNIHRGCRPIYNPELFSFAGEFFIDSCLRKNPKERFWIGVERSNLLYEEWFSTLDWKDLRKQTIRSPVLNALKLINNRAKLDWEEKTVQFQWGQVMDVMCPYTPSLLDEDIVI